MATLVAQGSFGAVRRHTTTRVEGDFAIDAEPTGLAGRRAAVADLPWAWLRQVHGAEVVVVTRENATEVAGSHADALVTADPGLVLAIQTADCVPVVLVGASGVVGAVHAGWRGIDAGVVPAAVRAMEELDAGPIQAWIGPHVGPECYEFGPSELDRLAARFGEEIRSRSSEGTPALDLATMTRVALRRTGVTRIEASGGCTACQAEVWFSHRARREPERMASVIWREPAVGA